LTQKAGEICQAAKDDLSALFAAQCVLQSADRVLQLARSLLGLAFRFQLLITVPANPSTRLENRWLRRHGRRGARFWRIVEGARWVWLLRSARRLIKNQTRDSWPRAGVWRSPGLAPRPAAEAERMVCRVLARPHPPALGERGRHAQIISVCTSHIAARSLAAAWAPPGAQCRSVDAAHILGDATHRSWA
jgi:hypothetical protein